MLQCPKCGRHYAADVVTCPEDSTPLRADATVAVRLPADPLLGQALDGKYRLDEPLGEGGMGRVYRATHLLIERPVAVKVLHPHLVSDEEARERFRREARAAGRLRHPNGVAVTDFGETPEGVVYIVMELLEGESLRELTAREAPLEAGRAVSIMLQVAAAVGAAHAAGVIHRDLKPANIFLAEREGAPPVVKVLDFGIAKLAADAAEDAGGRALTQTGIMIGTPRYMSPEQCEGGVLTPASDVYSLGIILYEMLTGVTPFDGATPLAVAMQHFSKPPRPLSDLNASVPPELERVVLRALEKQPGARPSSAGEFHHELFEAATRLGLAGAENGYAGTARLPRHAPTSPLAGTQTGNEPGDGATDHAGDATVLANNAATRRTHAGPAARGEAPVSAVGVAATPAPRTRLRVPLVAKGGWASFLKRPPVLLALGALALSLALVAALASRSRWAGAAPAAALPQATPAPAPTPEPALSPSPEPTPDEAAKRRQAANQRRQRRAGSRQPEKKESKIKSALNKVKKIIKNPF